ncbi:hypothetical protein U1Q18_052508 [Sarracenia purpurea var. burkii]
MTIHRGKDPIIVIPPRRVPVLSSYSHSTSKSSSRNRPPPLCHHCRITSHTRPNCYRLKRDRIREKFSKRSSVCVLTSSSSPPSKREQVMTLSHLNELAVQSSYLVA